MGSFGQHLAIFIIVHFTHFIVDYPNYHFGAKVLDFHHSACYHRPSTQFVLPLETAPAPPLGSPQQFQATARPRPWSSSPERLLVSWIMRWSSPARPSYSAILWKYLLAFWRPTAELMVFLTTTLLTAKLTCSTLVLESLLSWGICQCPVHSEATVGDFAIAVATRSANWLFESTWFRVAVLFSRSCSLSCFD